MVRDIANRYQGLPRRTPDMLLQVVRKFARAAIEHYPFIQEKKRDVELAREEMLASGVSERLVSELIILFQEFHFYLTCWLQIDLALYRLAESDQKEAFGEIRKRFHDDLELHLRIRKIVDNTESCVTEQFVRCGEEMACVTDDRYWFDGTPYSVDEQSVQSLKRLYDAIMDQRPSSS
ncbi:hypothetical protein EDM56_10340 [Brevibacillus fluminis]|uniref:Uncharacterized protein n=1 Tax=Brevibacillus fluminis TaxID=511487 RepID=A0A3M8DQ67_9BACL|nr:hypothetical protein [Brevibacillus fluminis]RNB89581.1 hypothetical protein EDM56_10340 [Brevibacillus fluminis]